VAGDVSALTDHLPDLVASRCVGCLACVSLCPDGAIHAVALPAIEVAGRIDAWAEDADQPRAAADSARGRFTRTARFTDAPTRHGALPAELGLFIDPERCKACGECVTACAALGHGALVRLPKLADEGAGASTVERYRRDLAFLRTLPPTPTAYRHEHAPTDLVLGPHAQRSDPGVASCPGCGAATMLRMLGIAVRGTSGPEALRVTAAFRCAIVDDWSGGVGRTAGATTTASLEAAIEAAVEPAGPEADALPCWVIAGDDALDADGVERLVALAGHGRAVRVLVLDRRSPLDGGTDRLIRRLLGRDDVFVALTTPAHQAHAYRALFDAQAFEGVAVVVAHAACQPVHGIAADAAWRQAHLAVQSRAFPLVVWDPRRGPGPAERCSLAGNPALGDDWSRLPDGTPVDQIAFARTEARLRAHLTEDGSPSLELQAIEADRLASWRFLQELAGVR
jgi:pyruvate/2-oxoacid:ferredoxin oxidoreductase beta subunit/NAD-dependent dihydropyrimidine dehydrogenase PreA subunit